jgi:myo-inositol 2-dehydrogenase/D-chiro-inositol 1-dehydrogenase
VKLGMGLIGAGRMGNVYARQLARGDPGVKLVAVVDKHMSRAEAIAAQSSDVTSYTHPRDLLERQDIDAVIIATPTNTHVEIIKDVAQARKHIFCEKPLALTLNDCDDAIAAAEKAKVLLQVGFMRRFDRAYATAKQ